MSTRQRLIFFVLFFVLFSLYGDESSVWTSQPDWVTGPETELEFYDNQMTYLLPFGIKIDAGTCWESYTDNNPVLYETDMGWPVPNEDETALKYLLFGDTKFFLRNSTGDIVNQIKDGNDVILSFDVSETGHNPAEIAAHELSESFIISEPIPSIEFLCLNICINGCGGDSSCEESCSVTCKITNYDDCLSFCDNDSDLLTDIADDPDPNISKCENLMVRSPCTDRRFSVP